MFEPHICAARVQFLKEDWEGRDRVIYEPGLLAWLAEADVDQGAAGPWRSLLEQYVPRARGRQEVWVVVDRAEEVVRYAPQFRGCRFLTVAQARALGDDPNWSVAIFDLQRALESSPSAAPYPAGDWVLARGVADLLDSFVRAHGRGRTLCVSCPGEAAGVGQGLDEDAFDVIVDSYLPGAASFMLSAPAVAAVYPMDASSGVSGAPATSMGLVDTGDDGEDESDDQTYFLRRPGGRRSPWVERTEPGPQGRAVARAHASDYDRDLDDAEESWTGRGLLASGVTGPVSAPDEAAEEDAIAYDNELGTRTPSPAAWMGVLGTRPGLDTLTLLDLGGVFDVRASLEAPSMLARDRGAAAREPAATPEMSAQVRALEERLGHARRRADEALIERQQLMEEIGRLREAQTVRATERAAVSGPSTAELEAELTAVRWSLEQANAQIEALASRPVEALEGQVALLRARLVQLDGGTQETVDAPTHTGEDGAANRAETKAATEAATATATATAVAAAHPVGRAAREGRIPHAHSRALARLEMVLKKLERGGGSALEFHRELRAIQTLLRPR